jgi:hypothetical protein
VISSIVTSSILESENLFFFSYDAENFPRARAAPVDAMKHELRRTTGLLLFAAAILCAGDRRVRLLPNLQPGQFLTYLIRFQSDKTVKTESKVVAPMAPNAAQVDAHGLLRVEILDVQESSNKAAIHARAHFLTPDSAAANDKNPAGNIPCPGTNGHCIEFTISPDGSVSSVKGIDSFSPDQQQAWQQWVSRFALAWTFPAEGMKSGEKWKSEQAEQAAAPITGLLWARQSLYVRDEPCRASQHASTGDISLSSGPLDTCAVLLTTATLKQKSSSKDATPEDFKLHELRTMGTAKGANEIITYISLKTGLIVRATEETSQSMDVIVAKADGSNGVHYIVDAKSHSEVLLVTETQ